MGTHEVINDVVKKEQVAHTCIRSKGELSLE